MSSTEIALVIVLFGMVAGVIAFFLRRLVNSVDKIVESAQEMQIQLEKRPTWDSVKELCVETAENIVVKHERDHHRIDNSPAEEFSQTRRN